MIQGFNSLSESDLRKLLEEDESEPLVTHRGERDPRSISKGWLRWLAAKLNLATKDELRMTTEAFDALKKEVDELRSFATDTDTNLDKAIFDIADLRKQIEDGSTDKQAMLDLADSARKTLVDARSSTYVPPGPPVENPTISEAD